MDQNPNERDYFLKKVNELSIIHLELLRLADNGPKALREKGLDVEKAMNLDIKDFVDYYLKGIDLEVIMAAHKDLYSQGFFKTNSDVYNIMGVSKGKDYFINILTPMGKKFVAACIPKSD
jgi:hypothetical protein